MAKRVRIVIDSASDMPAALRKAYGLSMVSQQITIDGVTYKDWVDIDPQALFSKLKDSELMSVTAQPAMADWYEVLEAARKDQVDLFILTMPQALSGTYGGALLAAKSYGDLRLGVRQARTVSLGSRLIIEELAKAADKGADLEALLSLFDDLNGRIRTYVVVGDMEMLKRGGRISASAALVGKALNIKPILEIDGQGRLTPLAKVRGWKKATAFLLERFDSLAEQTAPFGLAHAQCQPARQALKEAFKRAYPNLTMEEVELGAVIGSHVGPGTLGFAFFAKDRIEKTD